MSLSILDAFGAAPAAPGAPPLAAPLSALGGDGGPVDSGDHDASFVALLNAAGPVAAGEPAAALPAVPDIDPAAAAALQGGAWWLTVPAAGESAPESGASVNAVNGEADDPVDCALDPDDNAAAAWFIASGAVLTNLVVVDEAPSPQSVVTVGDASAPDEAGEAPASDGARGANASSPAYAIASRARHDAGVRRSPETNDERPVNDVAVATHAAAAERRTADGTSAVPAGNEPVTPATATGEATPAGNARVFAATPGKPVAEPAAGLPPSEIASNGMSNGVSSDQRAVAIAPDGAPRGPAVAAQATIGTPAEERRNGTAAARLASGIERGGGATAVASAVALSHSVSNQGETRQAVSVNADLDGTPVAVVPEGGEPASDLDGNDHFPGSKDGQSQADVPVAPASSRQASSATAGGAAIATSAIPVTPVPSPVPATAPAASTPATSGATPGPDTVPQLVQAIRMQYRAGGGEAVVRLNPEHLGAVSIALRVERGVVSATVHAESPAVRQWLEDHASSLRDGLSGHGLQLDRFVVHRDGRQPEQPRHYEEPQPQRRRAPRRQTGQEQATFEVRV